MVERDKGRLILKFLSKVETARELNGVAGPEGVASTRIEVPRQKRSARSLSTAAERAAARPLSGRNGVRRFFVVSVAETEHLVLTDRRRRADRACAERASPTAQERVNTPAPASYPRGESR